MVRSFASHPRAGSPRRHDGLQRGLTYSESYNRLVGVSPPAGAGTQYTYDARGNRATVAFNSGTTTYTYDANNRLLTEKNPLNVTTTYTYNLDGTRATKTDGIGNKTTYGYDANKRLTGVTFADTTSYTFAYDTRGHRTTEQSPTVNRTLGYNNLGQLATALDGLINKTITYGYDAVGNRVSLTYDGLTTKYAYDADRRLTTLTDPTGELTTMSYDAAGNRTQLAQGNGVVTTTTYDHANRPAQIASPVQSFAYTYDLAGNPYVKTYQDGTSETTTYDQANELTGITKRGGVNTAGYSYNGGNLHGWTVNGSGTQSSASNAFNEITNIYSASGTTNSYVYAYDNNGNRLTTAVHPPGGQPVQTTTYAWNDDDRMSGVTFPSGATNTYGYDANGIRVSKKDSVSNVNYLVDPQTQSILATYDVVAGTRLTTYNQNPQKIDEVLSYQVNSLKYYPHADMLGSVYAVSDVTAKAVATWTYDVWGTRTQTSGTLGYQFGFTGREHDPDTGLIYSRQRYYDPAVGSWTQPERPIYPITPDAANRYLYVRDGVTKLHDSDGRWPDGPPEPIPAPVAQAYLVLIGALIIGATIVIVAALLDRPDIEAPAEDLICEAAEGVGEASDTLVSVYHGSANNAQAILTNGLDPNNLPVWVTRDLEAATNTITYHPDLVPNNSAIIESQIPQQQFDSIMAAAERSFAGWENTQISSSEIVLRTPDQAELFNQYIVGQVSQ